MGDAKFPKPYRIAKTGVLSCGATSAIPQGNSIRIITSFRIVVLVSPRCYASSGAGWTRGIDCLYESKILLLRHELIATMSLGVCKDNPAEEHTFTMLEEPRRTLRTKQHTGISDIPSSGDILMGKDAWRNIIECPTYWIEGVSGYSGVAVRS